MSTVNPGESSTEKIRSFTLLHTWKEGHTLVLEIYILAKTFPKEEMYALGSQITRAAISITSNIAEGYSRRSYKEKIQFYYLSLGSLTELQNHLLIARDVRYLSELKFSELEKQSVTVHKLLTGLIKSSRKGSIHP